MAVSIYPSYKLLNAWQRVENEERFLFNQVTGNGVPRREGSRAYFQADRDDIARSLYEAVQAVIGYTEYYPRPVYITERIPLRGGDPYQLQTLQLKYKHLVEFGSRGTTLVAAAQAVVYSDTDGDGINDTATITGATSVTDVSQLQFFFQVADGAPAAADERYEIEPLTVTISGGNYTAVGHRSLFVKPSTIWDIPYLVDSGNYDAQNVADTADPNDFVTAVDVYQVASNTANAVQLVSDDLLFNCDCTSTTSTNTAAGARIVDARQSIVQVRAASCGCNRPYEAVNINYLAGLSLVNGRIAPDIEKALVRLANTFMWQEPCSLYEEVKNKWADDRNPMPQNKMQPADLNNPFGILKGQIAAWRAFNRPSRTIGQGGKLTANFRV